MAATVADLGKIFGRIENTLWGLTGLTIEQFHERLKKYLEPRPDALNEDFVYRQLVEIAFYAGFKSETVNQRLPTINRYFGDYRRVAEYSAEDIATIENDKEMITNKRKIEACYRNAKGMLEIVRQFNSFQLYFESFGDTGNPANLEWLKTDLRKRFRYLGEITVYHFLMELGVKVIKPDRVIMRIFHRLGLIDS